MTLVITHDCHGRLHKFIVSRMGDGEMGEWRRVVHGKEVDLHKMVYRLGLLECWQALWVHVRPWQLGAWNFMQDGAPLRALERVNTPKLCLCDLLMPRQRFWSVGGDGRRKKKASLFWGNTDAVIRIKFAVKCTPVVNSINLLPTIKLWVHFLSYTSAKKQNELPRYELVQV